MNNRIFKLIFSLTLLSVLFMIVGCGSGGGQGIAVQETPEAAVMRITDSWKASNTSPSVVVDSNNNFVRQAQTGEADEPQNKIITLYDMASNTYELKVLYVSPVTDNKATVKCQFTYTNGYLILTFSLVFDEGKWWLEEVEIDEISLNEGEATYIVKHIKLAPDGKTKIDVDGPYVGKIGDKVSAKPRTDYQDYEFISGDKRNVLEGTIAEDNSLTLSLYYKYTKKVKYTVKYIKLDIDGKVVEEIPETNWGVIGSTYEADTTKTIEDYGFLEGDKRNVLSGTIKSEKEELVLVVYYQYNKQATYTVKRVNHDTGDIIESKEYKDVIGKQVTVESTELTNYAFLSDISHITDKVKEDGTTILDLYYTEFATYTINFVDSSTGKTINSVKAKGKINQTLSLSNEQKTMTGWSFVEEGSTTSATIKADGSTVFTLKFLVIPPTYTVTYKDLDENSLDEKAGKKAGTFTEKVGKVITFSDLIIDLSGYNFSKFDPEEESVTLKAGDQITIVVYYEKIISEYTISGVVKDNAENLLKGATVRAFSENDSTKVVAETSTDADGEYVLTVPEPGKYILVITGEGYDSQSIVVEVKEGTQNARANCKL